MDRSCDGCTKCCDGHLTANIYGYEMGPKKPCHFVSKNGCSIYAMRPYNPCKGFKCVWKKNFKVPLEFKPDLIDMIMLEKALDDIPYVLLVPATSEITLEILDWAVSAVDNGSIENIVYQHKDQIRVISRNPDFIAKSKEQLGST